MDRLRFSTFLLLSAIALSAKGDFWSLGSFSTERNGLRELARVKEDVPKAVLASSENRFRIIVKKSPNPVSQKQALESSGYWPWTLHSGQIDRIVLKTGIRETVQHFLVVGSFSDKQRARDFLSELQRRDQGEFHIQVAIVAGIDYFRVVQGPFENRSMANLDRLNTGLGQPWWLTITKDTVRVAVDMDIEEEPVYTISPPSPDESYTLYCLYKANQEEKALYCKQDEFLRRSTEEAEQKGFRDRAALMMCAFKARNGSLENCDR